jgi:hypothetical protein
LPSSPPVNPANPIKAAIQSSRADGRQFAAREKAAALLERSSLDVAGYLM